MEGKPYHIFEMEKQKMDYELNENYKNILVLEDILNKLCIPHGISRHYDGWIIVYIGEDENCKGDIIITKYSEGHENDLMEAYGFEECGEDVIRYLNIYSALKLFINAYEKDKKKES